MVSHYFLSTFLSALFQFVSFFFNKNPLNMEVQTKTQKVNHLLKYYFKNRSPCLYKILLLTWGYVNFKYYPNHRFNIVVRSVSKLVIRLKWQKEFTKILLTTYDNEQTFLHDRKMIFFYSRFFWVFICQYYLTI